MNFRPCIAIPIYDHGSTIRAVVRDLATYGLPIYVVDDGSHERTRAELERVARDFPLVRLHRLERNSGKGMAMKYALCRARAEGMTHAVQIDADGQHDARDVPRFFARAAVRPEALIVGDPQFDASAPRARFYGRRLTNFWVCIETLSMAVKDSQCGFRLYPLAATCALLERAAFPRRMSFDIAIVVRLAWQGTPVENLPTRVIYPQGGLSHFDMLGDNVRISLLHTLLFFGMLARLPQLITRRLAARRLVGRSGA
jgi:glycosyltransferase involved in cell wall biosynthesis